jgi:hypothetical protein
MTTEPVVVAAKYFEWHHVMVRAIIHDWSHARKVQIIYDISDLRDLRDDELTPQRCPWCGAKIVIDFDRECKPPPGPNPGFARCSRSPNDHPLRVIPIFN